ncbi:hypothetical protein FVE85_3489 [Porphyridium purpureum]|uniref:Uncharacterized protein n=1 Tax=Porphyridium purpureum TaxID=35688 RepID=A0A5J4YKP6_PORPP|nr:hypothetical protein FVE85_3489 [Porphyridium purpureum]|eukprot:POR1395..scf249_10
MDGRETGRIRGLSRTAVRIWSGTGDSHEVRQDSSGSTVWRFGGLAVWRFGAFRARSETGTPRNRIRFIGLKPGCGFLRYSKGTVRDGEVALSVRTQLDANVSRLTLVRRWRCVMYGSGLGNKSGCHVARAACRGEQDARLANGHVVADVTMNVRAAAGYFRTPVRHAERRGEVDKSTEQKGKARLVKLRKQILRVPVMDAKERAKLSTGFREADLPARVCATPEEFAGRSFGLNGSEAFLMDIRKSNKKNGKNERSQEQFQVYAGQGNSVEFLDSNRALRQAVLKVDEPEREINIRRTVWDPKLGAYRDETITQKTGGEVKHFLVGMDEQHLFVCQLPKAATKVAQAREDLKPKALKNVSSASVVRQGEWFFTRVDRKLAARLDNVSGWNLHMECGLGVTQAVLTGRPHVADTIAVLDGNEYCKGRVRHPDHKTKNFHEWHLVRKNTETAAPQIKGLQWFD